MTMRKTKVTTFYEGPGPAYKLFAVRGVRTRNFLRQPERVTKQLLIIQEAHGRLLEGSGTDIGSLLTVMRKAERRWLVRHGIYEPVPAAPAAARYTRRRKFEEHTSADVTRLAKAQARRERQNATRL